jgi:hypothetical protein
MYQYHQHTITRYVSQPCTKACTKPSNLYHTKVHQPCTNNLYHNKCINHAPTPVPKCINHAPTPVPNLCINHAPYNQTMYQPVTMHQPCTINMYHMPHHTMYINTIPSTNTMYHTMYQPCTSTPVPYHVPTMYLNHIPYHSIMPYTIYHRIYQASTINGVPQPSTNITKRCISYMCCHIPSVILNNVSISMTTIHHVPMLQEYTKNKPQAYSIITM